jgi:hypothetical protein
METKTCKTCNETKDVSKFGKQKKSCNTCSNKKATDYRTITLPDSYIIKLLIFYNLIIYMRKTKVNKTKKFSKKTRKAVALHLL